jgi:hypothetical protein
VVLACAAIALILFLVRPGAGRLRNRIAGSIGTALQRQVDISKVHVRLLPQPGFDLEGFVVRDDPTFGAEPVLRCQDVTATLRLSSLIRGRLEISRLSLSEPSLNLVRRQDGRWNIATFLERTAGIPIAPTSKARYESRPGFPYIEADRGRINFKFGPEKKPFALTDAKYALWQESENTWGIRLRGQPVRTDFNLSDTGQLNVEGTWQRAATLHETPLEFILRWDGGQLGQLSKLVSGEDRGWRGTVRTSLNLSGAPSDLAVRADASLEDFHRYDITDSNALVLKGHCTAQYHAADQSLQQILCQTPLGDGLIAAIGDAARVTSPARFDLRLVADKVPMNAVLAIVRRAKRNLPDDLRATGTMDAKISLRMRDITPNSIEVDGGGETSDFRLQSEGGNTDLALDVVPFSVGSLGKQTKTVRGRINSASAHDSQEAYLNFGPVALKLGRPVPVSLQGRITRSGYSISLKGDSEIQRLLELARVSGIPAAHVGATGSAKLDLLVAGQWTGFASPITTGNGELHGVRAQMHGVNGPLEINSARVNLSDSETRLDAISASFVGTQWTGALSIPRPCVAPTACTVSFDLHADEISTDQLNHWLNPSVTQRPWYRFSTTTSGMHSFLAGLRASGTLAINRAIVRNLVATRVTTKLNLDQGKLRLSDLRADLLGGKHRGEWRADFTLKPPVYSGSGALDGSSLAQLADLMSDDWINGSANAKYQMELAGFSAADLTASAKGTLHFEMRDGVLPHIVVASVPLRVRRFTGLLSLSAGEIQLQDASLEAPAATYAVTGTASMTRKLDFRLVPEGSDSGETGVPAGLDGRDARPPIRSSLTVTGTLSDPVLSTAHRSETEAALKP